MAKVELKAQVKKLLLNTHKFNVDDIRESKDGNLFLLKIEGEVL